MCWHIHNTKQERERAVKAANYILALKIILIGSHGKRESRAEQRLPISAFLYAQRELHVEWETHARSRRGIEM